MYLRVLIYMNPLVFDKISKKFICEKDSGFLYVRQLIKSLPINWRFTIFVPKGVNKSFFDDLHIIECIEYDFSTSVHQNRYHFNRNILAKTFPYTRDVDVIINNQPEVTANLRVFFKIQRREKPIIINYFHWIDCKESSKFASDLSGFIFRQVEGYNEGDLNLFHNKYAYKLFTESAKDNHLYLKPKEVEFFKPQPTIFGCDEITLPEKKIILFNHRLNNTTGWKEIIKICDNIRKKRDDFVLWLTDENTDCCTDVNREWIITQNIPFKNYGYLLKKSHFSICNVSGYATWNMALLDSLYFKTPVIAPNTPLMSEMGATTTDNLEKTIEEHIETHKKNTQIVIKKDFNCTEWIKKILASKIKIRKPKKYDLVKESINNTTKRHIVNTFWSFHANSNFQKIRWNLLLDGFIDNTSLSDTTYNKPNTPFMKCDIKQQTLL